MPSTSSTAAVVGAQSDRSPASAAEAIVRSYGPTAVLAVGSSCAPLARELRSRDVDVAVIDRPDALGHGNGARTRPPDLVVVVVGTGETGAADIEQYAGTVAEHDTVLLSPPVTEPSSPGDDTGGSVGLSVRWAEALAEHGIFRDVDPEGRLTPHGAVPYRRADMAPADIVRRYEQALADLRASADADLARRDADVHELRREVLRVRDLAFGHQTELTTARARVAELDSELVRYDNVEQRLHEVLGSRSWRFTQALGRPVRYLRTRG